MKSVKLLSEPPSSYHEGWTVRVEKRELPRFCTLGTLMMKLRPGALPGPRAESPLVPFLEGIQILVVDSKILGRTSFCVETSIWDTGHRVLEPKCQSPRPESLYT